MVPNLELFDETLDINSTANYDMSIQVSHDEISFCLLDSIRKKYVLLRSFKSDDDKKMKTEMIQNIIDEDDFLNKKYRSTKIVIVSDKSTLVPAPLFDPAHKDDYFHFNHLHDEGKVILFNKINIPDTYIIYSVTHALTDLITNKFPGAILMHHLKPLLINARISHANFADNYIHLHIEKDFFNLLLFSNKILIFCNTFAYRNVSDIIYFVMHTFTNLGIRQEETIFLSGQAEHYDELYINMSEYIRVIKFAEPAGSSTYSYVFNELSLHKFLNLFNAINCA